MVVDPPAIAPRLPTARTPLTRIHDADTAARWGQALNAWHERWKGMLAERTYAKDHPDDPRAATSTSGWWWTHLPLRRAYLRLERLFKDGTLFCFLDPTLTAQGPVPRDSNRLEGGLWTHLPLRRAYLRLERLFKDGTLFCFLDPTLTAQGPVPRDSNRLEGGLNAALKRMLVNHRGLPEAHIASREGSTPRSSACSSTTAACPRRTCAAPANGTAT